MNDHLAKSLAMQCCIFMAGTIDTFPAVPASFLVEFRVLEHAKRLPLARLDTKIVRRHRRIADGHSVLRADVHVVEEDRGDRRFRETDDDARLFGPGDL